MQTARPSASEAPDLQQIETFSEKGGKLIIGWADKHESMFHYIWLLDNCFCPECGAEYTEKRVLRLLELPLNVTPSTVFVNGANLQINWSNGHTSVYDPAWLRAHCYSTKERARRHVQPILWGKELIGRLPRVAYANIVDGNSAHLKMLELIRDFGFVIIDGVDAVKNRIESVAKLAGHVRETYYGRIFDIRTVPNP
jgi:hypothetical protein